VIHSRIITVSVKRNTGDVFDAILQIPPKMLPEAKSTSDGIWEFQGENGPSTLKFNENRELGILDPTYSDSKSKWDIPMRVVENGDLSEISITLNKPEDVKMDEFEEQVKIVEQRMNELKQILESE